MEENDISQVVSVASWRHGDGHGLQRTSICVRTGAGMLAC